LVDGRDVRLLVNKEFQTAYEMMIREQHTKARAV